MRKQLQVSAVLSTSAFLALWAPLISFADEGWSQQNGIWSYTDGQGERVTEKLIQDGDNWYWLDENGIMVSCGLYQIKDDYYYFREDGTMVRGEWVSVPNPDAGKEDEPEQYWYYFQQNGKAHRRPDTGSTVLKAKTIDGKKYVFDTEGRMMYGWVSQGERQTGEDAWERSDYYFGTENDGAMKQGWVKLPIIAQDTDVSQPGSGYWEEEQERWFYFDNGKKVKGTEEKCKFKVINGNKYGFDQYGRMLSTWYTDQEVTLATSRSEAGEGNPYQGQKDYSREFMYFGTPESGALYTNGWFRARPSEYLMKAKYEDESTYMYYADEKGKIVVSEIKTIDGERYGFDNSGRQLSGMVCLKMEDAATSKKIDYSFYSDASETSGRGPFGSKKAFDELVETYAEDFQSGMMRFYYFGGQNGTMVTGKQQIQLNRGEESYEFMFHTDGPLKGSGVCGEKDGKLYKAGMLVKPDEESGERYAIYKQDYETLPEGANEDERKEFEKRDVDKNGRIEGVLTKISVDEFISEVCNSGIYDEDEEETVWTVRYDPEGVTYYLIDVNGNIVKNKKKASDGNGCIFRVVNKKIVDITQKE